MPKKRTVRRMLITHAAGLLFFLILSASTAFPQHGYQIYINLNRVIDDQVEVRIELPPVAEDEVEFHFPKIVPGTYTIYDFGRFISGFRAFDKDGNQLVTDSLSVNRKLIRDAQKLSTISYWVEDTYDSKKGNIVFEPAGTNIEDRKNFILNTFGFAGYLKNYKDLPFTLHITHPVNMYGSTALAKTTQADSLDTFRAANYSDLADGPIMYCVPDTTSFEMGGAKILVSVYSPNAVSKSNLVSGYIRETLEAQKDYLGGQLPIDRYAFLIYHFNGVFSGSLAVGALEHSYSSLYSMPELHPILISQTLKDFTAHEFFHIVTPLNIHSEEIRNFDFIEPKMSKHLWLYEGVTEYAAGLAQVKYGQMTMKKYMEVLLGKISAAMRYNDELPFTELSKRCLDEHKSQYGNVYQKGALIGLCMDITLLSLSEGSYGIQALMDDLAKRFGKDKAFQDDQLFDLIAEMTYPEVRDFFSQYVEGNSSLPLQEILSQVGILYSPAGTSAELSLGNIHFSANLSDSTVVVTDTREMNSFGKELGYQEGDIIIQFDKNPVDAVNFEEVFEGYKKNRQSGDKISVIVLRKNLDGKLKKQKLTGHALEVKTLSPMNLETDPNATSQQIALRKSWILK